MSDSEKTSLAALMSVIIRRKHNRSIDVKWLIKNDEYAREIIKLSREHGPQELIEYADHLEILMFGNTKKTATQVTKSSGLMDFQKTVPPKVEPLIESDENGTEADISKYIGHLR